MNTTLEPPAERDLPAGRRAEMRAGLIHTITQPDHGAARADRTGFLRRWAVGAAACLAVAASGATLALLPGDDPTTLAYGGGAIAPEIQRAADQCLEDNRWWEQRTDISPEVKGPAIGTENLTLVNLFGRGQDAGVVFTAPAGIVYCFNSPIGGRSINSGAPSPWLPGPVSTEASMTGEFKGTTDRFASAGRVSRRVGRVVLDHGNGTRTPAHVAGGTFIVIASGTVDLATSALVIYDTTGAEIDRRPAHTRDGLEPCYTDPSGAVVKGARPGGDCRAAEQWS